MEGFSEKHSTPFFFYLLIFHSGGWGWESKNVFGIALVTSRENLPFQPGNVKFCNYIKIRSSSYIFCIFEKLFQQGIEYIWNIKALGPVSSSLRTEFDFWNVHGIMNTSGLLQSKRSPKGFTLTLQETRSIHNSMNIPKIEFITYIYILL